MPNGFRGELSPRCIRCCSGAVQCLTVGRPSAAARPSPQLEAASNQQGRISRMPIYPISRRELLKLVPMAGAGAAASTLLPGCGGVNKIIGPSQCGKITDVDHVVVLMQE